MGSKQFDGARRTAVTRLCGYGSALAGSSLLPGCGAAGQEQLQATAGHDPEAADDVVQVKATAQTRRFVATAADFPNPDRGLAAWGFDLMEGSDSWLDNSVFPVVAAHGFRLVRCQTILASYGYLSGADLSAANLDSLRRGLRLLRRHGLKCIYRFMYASPAGGEDYREPPHPPLSAILKHIEQIGSVFRENRDVLAALEAGFLGPWGEWHSSALVDSSATRLQVKNQLLSSFPGIILFRRPAHIREWYGDAITRESGGPPEARRIGMHNDSILSLGMHNGHTWRSNDFSATSPNADLEDDRLYIRRLVWWNAYGGEIAPEEAANSYLAAQPDPVDHANKDFFFNHLQYLNAEGSALKQIRAILDAHNPDFYPAWIRRIGYRIALKSVTHDERVTRGGRFAIALSLRNEGVARMLHPRPLQLRLVPRFRGGSTRDYTVSGVNPWDWVPTYDHLPDIQTGTQQIALGNIAGGDYDVGIRLPDANARLAADPRYCVRPANADVAATSSRQRFQGWDASTGTFMLGTRVSIA